MAASASSRPPAKWRRQLNSMNAMAASLVELREDNARLMKFLTEISQIVKMPIDTPETIVSALRDVREDFDRFAAWAQPYLDSGHWGGHSILDAIKKETIKRDREIAEMSPFAEDNSGDGICFFCGRMELEKQHEPDCLWAKAKQAVGEEVAHG